MPACLSVPKTVMGRKSRVGSSPTASANFLRRVLGSRAGLQNQPRQVRILNGAPFQLRCVQAYRRAFEALSLGSSPSAAAILLR